MRKDEFQDNAKAATEPVSMNKTGAAQSGGKSAAATVSRAAAPSGPQFNGPRAPAPKPPFGMPAAIGIKLLPSVVKTPPKAQQAAQPATASPAMPGDAEDEAST